MTQDFDTLEKLEYLEHLQGAHDQLFSLHHEDTTRNLKTSLTRAMAADTLEPQDRKNLLLIHDFLCRFE